MSVAAVEIFISKQCYLQHFLRVNRTKFEASVQNTKIWGLYFFKILPKKYFLKEKNVLIKCL